jgi:hypothetical protein
VLPRFGGRLPRFILISGGGKIFYPAFVSNLIAIVRRPNVGKSALFKHRSSD